MGQLREELKKTLSAELPNMQSQLRPVKQILDQYGNAFTTGSQKAQAAIKQTGDKVKQTAQATQQAAEAEKAALQSVEEEHRRINEVVAKQYAEEQRAKLAQTSAYVAPTVPNYPSALATQIDARQSAPEIPAPQLTGWQRFTAQYYAILDNVKAALNKVGLYGQEGMGKVASATNRATTATKKWGQQAESSSNKATSGFSRTTSMIGRMIVRMAVWRTISALIDAMKTGIDDMAHGTSKANSTMSQLATSVLYLKNSIGAALMPAIQAITPVLTQIIDKIADLFNWIGMLNARIFGGATTVTVAKQAQVNYAETLGKTGDAAKKAAEKAEESVLSFDKLNKLNAPKSNESDAGAGMPSYESMFTTKKIPAQISAAGDKIKTEFAKWRQYAQPTIDAFKLFNTSLEPLKTFAAKGFEDFYNDYLVPIGKWNLGTGFPEFLNILTTLNLSINWNAINAALDKLWKALEPFTEHVGEGLLWFLDNVWRPIATFTGNVVITKLLDILATSIDIVDQAIEKAKQPMQWFYEGFLKPLGQWTGGTVSHDLDLIADSLHALDNLMKGDTPAAAQDAQKALKDLWNIIGYVLGANGNSLPIKSLGSNVSQSTKTAIEAFNALNTSADKDLKELEWSGDTVTKAMAGKINKNVQGMADDTIAGFKRQAVDSIKNIQDLASVKGGGISKSESDQMIKNINIQYNAKIKAEADGQSKIQTILNNASKEKRGLTKTESDQINKIKSQMYTSGVKALSKNQVEEQAILENMRVNHTNLSAQEAADIVKDSKATTDQTITDANTKYKGTLEAIIRERDETHTISSDQADKLIAVAKKQRDDSVKNAEDQHQKVVAAAKKQAGECVNQVDWESGQVKTKWEIMSEFFAKAIPTWWKSNIDPWFTKEKWEGLFNNVKQTAQTKWNEIISWWKNSAIANWWKNDVAPWFTLQKWQSLGQQAVDGLLRPFKNIKWPKIKVPEIKWSSDGAKAVEPVKTILQTLQLPTQLPKLNIQWNANGGVYDSRSIIGVGEYAGASSNPEIVAPQKIMRDTVVEANGEAVSAIAGLIYQLIDAVRESGGGDIYLDGEKLSKNTISHINGTIRRTGKSPILA